MATGQKSIAGPLFTLFHVGAIGTFSDRQLLECIASGDHEPAEFAFTALVERHGPMVLRVCSALLRDPHDAQDAFQATFLVLIRKSHELWVHDSLGPWMHRVARRTAERAQALARRRRECERRAAESRTILDHSPRSDTTWSILHDEIDRLPERLRVLVVLCHLEGQSQALAARTLSLPIGTVKSRLHRARDLLRDRLTQRGAAFSAGLLSAKPAPEAADALRSLPLFESMVHAASRAGVSPAARSSSVRASAIHLFEETIKTMFLTRIKIGVALALLAGSLALGAAGVFAQQDSSLKFTTSATANGAQGKATGGLAPAPSYIRRSRTMIIERLEQELSLAEQRLDLTTANVRTPNDPEVVRARKTVETLAGLLKRVDGVLMEAVDEFPTIFDFSNAPVRRGAAADHPAEERAEPGKAAGPPAGPTYDEHSLAQSAERMEWARRMYTKGYVSKAECDRCVAEYEALKARIDADIARGADRVDWAKRMHEKGYVSKTQYEAEILKHYDAIKARLQGQSQAVTDELLHKYELLKAALQKIPAPAGPQSVPESRDAKSPAEKPAAPAAKPEAADRDNNLTPNPPVNPAADSTPGNETAKPASDSRPPK